MVENLKKFRELVIENILLKVSECKNENAKLTPFSKNSCVFTFQRCHQQTTSLIIMGLIYSKGPTVASRLPGPE